MIGLKSMGLIGIIILLILILLIPFIVTILVGIGFANYFGFTGILWWSFVILFYLIISAILTFLGR